MTPMSSTSTSGFGRVIVIVYAVLALAATGRSLYQLLSDYTAAPLAYSLSAVAAVVYIVATIALARTGPRWRTVALAAIGFELLGVIAVGTLSLTHPELFAHPSVWSGFGIGYLGVPAVLPFVGLWWLLRGEEKRVTA